MDNTADGAAARPPIRVMALHALAYCERLFYLEEIEEIRVADHRVYDGRRLHEALDEEGELVTMQLESDGLGIKGKLDALRRRGGQLIPYEHKKGRSRKSEAAGGAAEPWPSDRLQVAAYALLLEEATGEAIPEARIRYHADGRTVRVPIDEAARGAVHAAVARAHVLSEATLRPPVTTNERLCVRCSLAPVCLPEEARQAEAAARPGWSEAKNTEGDAGAGGEADPDAEAGADADARAGASAGASVAPRAAARLFPVDDERRSFHVEGHGTRIGRSGDELAVTPLEGAVTKEPINEVRSVTLHGYVGMSAQALQLCADNAVAVHWLSASGTYVGSFFRDDLAVQRRIRQYDALREESTRLRLARALVAARAQGQLRFVLRATQGRDRAGMGIARAIDGIRHMLPAIERSADAGVLLGIEGQSAACYFEALPALIDAGVDEQLRPRDRNRRPPLDPFNALLSFGYGMLLREVTHAIRSVGLDGAFGFYHRPRSSAPPLALDLMELFRVPVVDMPVVAAVNRKQFDPNVDFTRAGRQVWLSDSGRRKLIDIFERRLSDVWRHPILEYSLSYRRHIELEVRLLEKEWSGEAGLFASTRLR